MAYIAEKRTGLIVDECQNYDPLEVDSMIETAMLCGYGVSFCEATESGDCIIWVD